MNNQTLSREPKKEFFRKKGFLILIIFIIIFIFSLGIWFFSKVSPFALKKEVSPREKEKEERAKEIATYQAVGFISRPIATPDTDNDGLYDREEARFGTNPNLADTDGDGLNDFEEINLGTNPLKADTDGDGFKDGEEVKQGFNPLGPGKLK